MMYCQPITIQYLAISTKLADNPDAPAKSISDQIFEISAK